MEDKTLEDHYTVYSVEMSKMVALASEDLGLSSKVVDMLATKKQEVSNNMFADKVEVEPEEEIQAEPEEVVTEPIIEPEEETTEVQA